MTRHHLLSGRAASVFALVVLAGVYIALGNKRKKADGQAGQPEIQELRSEARPEVQRKLVTALVSRLGPEAAQEELLRSGLPFTGDSHLVIHTVGGLIYEKYGIPGIVHCRPYFLGACYHGFLLDAVGERGPDVIPGVWSLCRQAGPATMMQCTHAAGHGLLAWNKYSVPDALANCDATAARMESFAPFNCYDGVFMENVWKLHHVHGPEGGEATTGLEHTCDAGQLQQKYQSACWGNQVTVLYNSFHGDLAKIAQKCDSLRDKANKESCFDGLARQINPVARGSADETFRLCGEATSGPRRNDCLIINAEAAFAVGDEVNMPFEICRRIDDSARGNCYERLSSLIAVYAGTNVGRAEELCARIGERKYVDRCKEYDRYYLAHTNQPIPDITGGSAQPIPSFSGGPAQPIPNIASGSAPNFPATTASPSPYLNPYAPYQYPYPYPMPRRPR